MNPKITGRKLQNIESKTASHPNLSFNLNLSNNKIWTSCFASTNTQIEFDDLVKDYQIKELDTFSRYLIEIWKDLANRSKTPLKGIQKITFMSYYELPGIISDRLFATFDRSNNGYISAKDFIQGMIIWFSESFKILSKFIFQFYDFDQDGFITREDVRVVLSYVPLQKTYSKMKMKYEQEDFRDRVESQTELHQWLNKSFGKLEKMNEEEFINMIDNVNSDIFIFIWIFLFEKRPFTSESITVFWNKKNDQVSLMFCKTPKMEPHKIASPSLKSKFVSPSLKKRTLTLTKQNNILNEYAGKVGLGPGVKKSTFVRQKEIIIEEKKSDSSRVIPQRKPRKLLGDLEEIYTNNKPLTLHVKSEVKEEKSDSDSDKELETEAPLTDKPEEEAMLNTKPITFSSYLYKITRSKKLKTLYFKLIGKDFYYFKTKEDLTYKGMHNLSGIYIKENPKETYNDFSFFNFSVCYPHKTRTYYTESEEDYLNWVHQWSLVLDSKKIWDQYDLQEKIGKGKFGWVKLAIHKETKRKVAIKIMTKKNMTSKDLEQAKTEIDILKVCQHPNIIKLYDVIDNKDYIYIIMEYCSGKDWFGYIEQRNYRLPEKRTAQIIHQWAMAIYYIHSYGIVHRDLKPENIIMTDNSDTADIRLLDFGLSKIVGPNEKCKEPYGTLSYVAPEVLLEIPYDKSVDLWTIGIITHLLWCGFLPFDDEHSEKEIARQTIQDPVDYPKEYWDDLSTEVRDFVDKTVMKKPEQRLKIEEIWEHPWFKKYELIPDFRSKVNRNDFNFVKYATDKKE